MISLLIYILVVCIVIGLLYWLIQQIPLPDPFGRIANVALVVIGILIIVFLLLGLIGGVPTIRPIS